VKTKKKGDVVASKIRPYHLTLPSRGNGGGICSVTASRPALRPTQPPIQQRPGALSRGIKELEHEAEHSLPSNAEVKNEWSYTSIPPIRLHDVVLS
jgi:hypothetical protein